MPSDPLLRGVCVSGGGSAASKILMNQCLTFLVVYCPPLSKSDGWIKKD